MPPFPAFPSVSRYVAIGSIEEAFARVCRSIEARDGISLVFGPPGTGKSLLTKAIIEAYTDSRDVIVVGENPIETPQAFYQHVLHHLGVAVENSAQADLQLPLIDRINGKNAPAGGLVIVVDEAQSLNGEVLEAIRRTTNIMRRDEPRVCAVLCGGPALEDTLARPSLQPFVQRVATRCYLHPLNAAETTKYITESIRNCGAEPDDTITDEAIAAVHHACNGVPRLINQMMTQAIDTAEAAGQVLITDMIVDRAWALLQQLPSPMVEEQSFAGSESAIEFGQLDDLDEIAPAAKPAQPPASIADTKLLSAVHAADDAAASAAAQSVDCDSCGTDCDQPCATQRDIPANHTSVSSAPAAAAFDDLGPAVEFDFSTDEPVAGAAQAETDAVDPADNDRPLIASEDDQEITCETTVRLDELQSMSEIVIGGFEHDSTDAGAAQIACEPALIDPTLEANDSEYQYPASNGNYDIDQVETQHLAQSQQAVSSQSTAELNGVANEHSVAAELYSQPQDASPNEPGRRDDSGETGASAYDLPSHAPSVAGVPHARPINQSLYSASTIDEGQYTASGDLAEADRPQSPAVDPVAESPAAKELFGSFEDEVVVPVAAGPGAGDPESLDLNSIYGQTELESILHQEIVGMSADASRLHVFHDETESDLNAAPDQRRRADGAVRATRQPVLWLTESDEGELVRDDSDLLIIEDSVEVSPVAPEVTFDEDEQPVSVDFQAMLERMRSSG